MGATVVAYWPDISEDQLESQPGFWNDCKAWGSSRGSPRGKACVG